MTSPWASTGGPVDRGQPDRAVTVIEGSTFAITDHAGRISPGYAHGVFVRDTRVLSRWELRIDGAMPEPLTTQSSEPYGATFLSRVAPAPGQADSTLLVSQSLYVGDGMRADIAVRNYGRSTAACTISVVAAADFADLFEVKEGRANPAGDVVTSTDRSTLTFARQRSSRAQAVRIVPQRGAAVNGSTITWRVSVPPRGRWQTCLEVHVVDGESTLRLRHPCGVPLEHTLPARSLREWRDRGPELTTADADLAEVLRRSVEDLGSLRIVDPEHPDRAVVAAGAPWFMALFGRDSLLTSWMLLPLDHRLALGTLQTLAAHQGTAVNPATEEQPGRILHEMRFGPTAALALGGGNAYYGTADATPLFVMLLAELHRWGVDRAEIESLLPHADRALDWIERYGDADGDGFVEYQRASDQGLVNQGWKDSWDGITYADGRLAQPPIALAEVQGYVYAAYLARAHLAGDTAVARHWRGKADALKRAFNDQFWLPDRGWFALGLDAAKHPVDSLTSNIGHCLWTGIIDEDKAPAVAEHLLSPQMFSGWGIRTLATSMGAYNPLSYHNGSVWPHDNALCAAGLMRYGFVEHAQRVVTAIVDAAAHFDHRLPELFCGFARAEFPAPIPFPTSCSPQAWAAAAPLSLLRTVLRFEPHLPGHCLGFAPALPERYLPLRISGLAMGERLITIDVTADEARIDGLDDFDLPHPPHREA
ncbi:glycogen debranching N-terminal domain-containing protein [Amycolatopsis benzoatilytica]|uniref:amylo-alpha-1,6-glucosidase n=1 Tax=Amycolatopsis benzoatilytica TaxID=346045 RepID=UPI00037D69A1|nr:glycogen debranching N-terminal domain-containing protein [Amycolatopsis benzoatilytica]